MDQKTKAAFRVEEATIGGLHEAIRADETTVVDVVQQYIARVRAFNGVASMLVTATLAPTASGTTVDVVQDLQLSGAAAQYGRGMISDVSSVLMRDFADNMQKRIAARDTGAAVDTSTAAPAGGFAIGVCAAWMALCRVARRFFMPYQPTPS